MDPWTPQCGTDAKCGALHGRGWESALTHDGGVGAVGDAGDGVDAREDGADVVLVQLDGVRIREEVVAVRGCCRPVGVRAPVPDALGISICP